jgi:two-component system response regulator AtoC
MPIEKILIVDDEALIRDFLAETLKRKSLDVTTAEDGLKALALIKEHLFDIVITDMKMPDLTGIDLLQKIKEISPQTIIIVITAYGSIENAVEAMRLGAYNYLIKPFSPDTLEAVLEKAREHLTLIHENHYLRQQGPGSASQSLVIGDSVAIKKIMEDVIQIATSNASVFINGESGTGKEVIAQAIHFHSQRSHKSFIKVNCAAIPETLVEAEFFGHEKGAFTGANAKRLGRFELANSGTLLLDEVTEIPIILQAKLLRAIQEQEFERIGGTKAVKVDVRIISTSNRDIKEAIFHKHLREDLYYRLNVIPIHLPPLRERREDIIPLARHFLQKFCNENHKENKQLSLEAEKKLLAYQWPGNVRELANIIERAVVMDSTSKVSPDHLFIDPQTSFKAEKSPAENGGFPTGLSLQELEKRLIIETFHQQDNNPTKTAKILGISTRKLRNKLQEYSLLESAE